MINVRIFQIVTGQQRARTTNWSLRSRSTSAFPTPGTRPRCMVWPYHKLIPNVWSKTRSRHEALGQIACAAAHFAHSPSTSTIDFIGLKPVVFAAPRNPRVTNSDAVSRTAPHSLQIMKTTASPTP